MKNDKKFDARGVRSEHFVRDLIVGIISFQYNFIMTYLYLALGGLISWKKLACKNLLIQIY